MKLKIISNVLNNKWVNPYHNLQNMINKKLRQILSPQNNGLIFKSQYEIFKKYIMAQPEFEDKFQGNYSHFERRLFIKINDNHYEWKQKIQNLDNLASKLYKKTTDLPNEIIEIFKQSKSREVRYKYPCLSASRRGNKTKHLEKEPYFSLSFIIRPSTTFINGYSYLQKYNFNLGKNSINVFFHGNLDPTTMNLFPDHNSVIRYGLGTNLHKNGLATYINRALKQDFPSMILFLLKNNSPDKFDTILHYIAEEVNFAIKEWHHHCLDAKPMPQVFTREELLNWKHRP